MNKDIKFTSKGNNPKNLANGRVDWDISNGKPNFVYGNDLYSQAVAKCIVTETNPLSGYGVGLKDFRGMKNTTVVRMCIITRVLRSLTLLEKYYQKRFVIDEIITECEQEKIRLLLKLDCGEIVLEV